MRCRSQVVSMGLVMLVAAGCADGAAPEPGIANPASEHCVELGGEVELREDADGAQHGVCVFPDGVECDEWELYRGACAPGSSE
jgi:uncharacterized protein